MLRCDAAIELLKKNPRLNLLPTGAFGASFNSSDRPHGYYLRKYLVERGVADERILPHTESSNTLEDALVARHRLYRSGFLRDPYHVFVITSVFHTRRADFIFRKIFADGDVSFVEAADPSGAQLMRELYRHERKALVSTMRKWVNVPLYVGQGFPDAIYENASAEHKHYDNLSVFAITGILVVFAFPFSALEPLTKLALFEPCLVGSALIILFLCALYVRFAEFAADARRVMYYLEVTFDSRGFSSSYPRGSIFGFHFGAKEATCVVAVIFVVILIGLYFARTGFPFVKLFL